MFCKASHTSVVTAVTSPPACVTLIRTKSLWSSHSHWYQNHHNHHVVWQKIAHNHHAPFIFCTGTTHTWGDEREDNFEEWNYWKWKFKNIAGIWKTKTSHSSNRGAEMQRLRSKYLLGNPLQSLTCSDTNLNKLNSYIYFDQIYCQDLTFWKYIVKSLLFAKLHIFETCKYVSCSL